MEARFFIFGPFVLIPEQQALYRGDLPVRMGNRAFDILALLVQRAGKLVTKQELIALVWPDTFVDESNLKVHIAALRKALDADVCHLSCIATVIGRGYRFVAPVQIFGKNAWARPAKRFFNFPGSSRRLAGRDITKSGLKPKRNSNSSLHGLKQIPDGTVRYPRALPVSQKHGMEFTAGSFKNDRAGASSIPVNHRSRLNAT